MRYFQLLGKEKTTRTLRLGEQGAGDHSNAFQIEKVYDRDSYVTLDIIPDKTWTEIYFFEPFKHISVQKLGLKVHPR